MELRTLREKINQDYNNLPIRDLCVQTSGTYEVTFFNLEKKFCNMVSRIAEIKSSQIFNELWQKHGKDLKKEVMTMEIMCDNLWKPICDELKAVNRQFLSGDMLLKDIDNYLKLFNMDYVALKTEFLLLSKFFSDNGTSNNDKVEQKLDARIERVKKYQKLFDARDASEAIEVLRKKMNLQGDFSAIKKLKEVSLCTCVMYMRCIVLLKAWYVINTRTIKHLKIIWKSDVVVAMVFGDPIFYFRKRFLIVQ